MSATSLPRQNNPQDELEWELDRRSRQELLTVRKRTPRNISAGRVRYTQVWLKASDLFVLRSHINEDKRKTEGQKQIFDVVYEVDGCPVSESVPTLRGVNRGRMLCRHR